MFDVVELNLSGLWHTPTLGELGELLVFYDRVHIRAPLGRLGDLLPADLDDLIFFRELVEARRIIVTIDQLPLGEVAWELGLFENFLGVRASPRGARARMMDAYPEDLPAPRRRGDAAAQAAWAAEWERLISKVWESSRNRADYLDGLIANARRKTALIAEPSFLTAALAAFGQGEDPETQAMLRTIEPRQARFEGQPITGFKSPGIYSAAMLLEFLSQADVLLDTVDGQAGRDAYTSPKFDRWSRSLVAGAVERLGVGRDIDAFQTSVLGTSSISGVIDAGERRFRDLAGLLDKREPFAKAVRNQPVDQSLVTSYFKEIENASWFTHGPGKIVRFSVFSAAGLALAPITGPAGPAAGVALGAIDAFVVDKLVKGNACRAFVDQTLKPFVAKD